MELARQPHLHALDLELDTCLCGRLVQIRSLRGDLDEGRTGSTLSFLQIAALRLEPPLPPGERGCAEAGLLCKSPTGKTAGSPGLNLADPLFSRHPRSSHAAENDRDLSTSSERGPLNGYFFHAYVLIITIILLYYNLRRDVLVITGIFAATNIAFTTASLALGPAFFGVGYMTSCVVCFLISYSYLAKRIAQLEYLTFSGQPIVGKREDSPELRARPGGGYGQYIDLDDARASV